jgi:RNA polymerase sigma factor (sigma-70 family)
VFLLFATLYAGPDEGPVEEAEVLRLIAAAQVGNARAAQRLYSIHVARLFRFVRASCSSEAEAEDVTQQAFVDALSHLYRFQPQPGRRFLSWLIRLAINRIRKKHRVQRRFQPSEQTELASLQDEASTAEIPEETLFRRRKLLAALSTLSERDRQVVSLFYGAELSAGEVGEELNLSAAHVRKISERSRAKLMQELGIQND